ncbi:MAG: MotA/TolQ/ExbB proton channel family protein [Deltaproteobacteria bacterium]|nr:MotA/TolQ/ExbB proton channel family protein [Deltaproteobacteria bacterium]
MTEYMDLITKGGPLMVPILLCSVVALAIFLERLLALKADRIFPPRLAEMVLDLTRRGQIDAAVELSKQQHSPLSALVVAGLESRGAGRAGAKERIEEVGGVEVAALARYVGGLSTVATVSPLLGLLGTVTGMIKVFKSVASVQDPQIGQLAGGIWEALLTTVAGLAVAIPAYLAYRYLEGRIDKIAGRLEEYGLRLLDELFPVNGRPEGDA